jgi:hypothetical protein
VELDLATGVIGDPFGDQSIDGAVATMTVDDGDAPEAAIVHAIQNIAH